MTQADDIRAAVYATIPPMRIFRVRYRVAPNENIIEEQVEAQQVSCGKRGVLMFSVIAVNDAVLLQLGSAGVRTEVLRMFGPNMWIDVKEVASHESQSHISLTFSPQVN